MMLSAEVRWFWRGGAPTGLIEWFMDVNVHGHGPGGGPPGRRDVYLIGNHQCELGIKTRGKKDGGKVDLSTGPRFNSVENQGPYRHRGPHC